MSFLQDFFDPVTFRIVYHNTSYNLAEPNKILSAKHGKYLPCFPYYLIISPYKGK